MALPQFGLRAVQRFGAELLGNFRGRPIFFCFC